ncbi:MAG: exodeoxyribonuclease VII small subunit [Polyangia bacterium]
MPSNDTKQDDASKEGFDETLTSLKQVVDQLEGGQLSLEKSLAAFEDGVRLARRGASILDAAERRVEILLKAEPGAAPVIAPFSDGQSDTQSGPQSDAQNDGSSRARRPLTST